MNTTEDNFGLSGRDLSTITDIFRKYDSVQKVLIFGSRSCGKYHAGSDIDLAIVEGNPTILELGRIQNDFEESTLPYFIDVLLLTSIKDETLKRNVSKGRLIYHSAMVESQ